MPTLALDLRDLGAAQIPPSGARSRGAAISVLVHGIAVVALVLVPLLLPSLPPMAVNASGSFLVQPANVTPPLPPPARTRLQRSPGPSTRTQLALDQLDARKAAPLLVSLADPTDRLGDVEGEKGAYGTDPGLDLGCPVGSLCGDAPLPVASPSPAEIPRVGGLIKEPRLAFGQSPQYPPLAQRAGVSGKVVIEAHVGRDGLVKETRIIEGSSLFDAAALSSVRSRRYEPLLLNGIPSDFLVTITVVFSIRP